MASGKGHLLIRKFKASGLTAEEFINKTFGSFEKFCDVINAVKNALANLKETHAPTVNAFPTSGFPYILQYISIEHRKVAAVESYLGDLHWLLNKYKSEQHPGFFRRLFRRK